MKWWKILAKYNSPGQISGVEEASVTLVPTLLMGKVN